METENLIGQQIDQYRITASLAQGGMAEVFIAQDVHLQREVVLKVMLAKLAQNEAFAARFRREAQTTARLNHPNIIQVYGAGFTPMGRPYLAMQYIRGGSLQDWLEKLAQRGQRLSTADSLKIASEIADALHAAHEAGIVHRDLKPSNILLHPNGTPVLTDLGIATVRSELTRLTEAGSVVGTPQYMAPEQAKGQTVDGRSDIYSLGVILYELLAGKAPFAADSPLALLHQHVHEPPPPLMAIRPDLTPATLNTVDACLQKEPDHRFQSAEQLAAALEDAIIDEGLRVRTAVPPSPSQADPPSPTVPSPSSQPTTAVAWRRRLGWFIAAAILLLLVIMCGLFQWLRPASEPRIDLPVETPLLTVVPTDTPLSETAVPAIITANVLAPRLTSPLTIDGDLADWPAMLPVASAYTVFAQDSWDRTDDVEASWLLGWDANNLYAAVTVVDDIHVQVQSDQTIYRGDSVEIQVDTDLAGDYGTPLNPDDFQINLSPGDFQTVPSAVFLWQANENGRYEPVSGQGILMAARPTGSGYVIEMMIPWSSLNVTPSAGQQLGIALNVSDNDGVGTAVQEMMKSHVETRTYRAPDTWGTLTLQE